MLVGRVCELESLVEGLAAGRPVALAGEMGIGKTTLARAAIKALGRQRYDAPALATLSWMAYLPICKVLGREVGDADPADIVAAVRGAVGEGVLLLDDLQWADADTLALVPALAANMRVVATVAVGEPASGEIDEMLTGAGVEVLALAGLGDADADELVRAIGPDLSAESRRAIIAVSGGNPFLLCALADSPEGSGSVRKAMESWLRTRPPQTLDTLQLLAILGRPIAATRLDRPHDDLVASGLVAARDGELFIRHRLLAEVALAGIEPERRRALHQCAATLANGPGERARHLFAADDLVGARCNALEAAASARHPRERALSLSLAATCTRGPDADDLLLEACDALLAVGEHAQAALLALAVSGDAPEQRAAAALRVARCCRIAGDNERARKAVEDGLGCRPDADTEVGLLIELARLPVTEAWDPAAAVTLAEVALARASAVGAGEVYAADVLARAHLASGSHDAAEHFERAVEAARVVRDHDAEFRATVGIFTAGAFFGRPDLAYQAARSAAERARVLGVRSRQLEFSCFAAFLDGLSFANLQQVVAEGVELLDEPLTSGQRDLIEAIVALARADLGNDLAARDVVRRALAPGRATPTSMGILHWVRAEIDLVAGRPRAAIAAVDDCMASPRSQFPVADVAPLVRQWACLDLGLPVGSASEPSAFSTFAGAVHESRALVALARPGQGRLAAEQFSLAAQAWNGKIERNALRCLWAAGEIERTLGGITRARRYYLEAESRGVSAGMTPLITVVRRSLRRTGLRRSAPRTRTAIGLTGRECEVLTLVRAGNTTTQIALRLGVAPSSVDTMIKSAMLKTGARTRIQAAVRAATDI